MVTTEHGTKKETASGLTRSASYLGELKNHEKGHLTSKQDLLYLGAEQILVALGVVKTVMIFLGAGMNCILDCCCHFHCPIYTIPTSCLILKK